MDNRILENCQLKSHRHLAKRESGLTRTLCLWSVQKHFFVFLIEDVSIHVSLYLLLSLSFWNMIVSRRYKVMQSSFMIFLLGYFISSRHISRHNISKDRDNRINRAYFTSISMLIRLKIYSSICLQLSCDSRFIYIFSLH